MTQISKEEIRLWCNTVEALAQSCEEAETQQSSTPLEKALRSYLAEALCHLRSLLDAQCQAPIEDLKAARNLLLQARKSLAKDAAERGVRILTDSFKKP